MAKVRTHCRYASRDRRRGQPVGAHAGEPGLELLDGRVADRPVAERAESREVALVRVDGARRPAGLQGEQEAFDIGVGSTHGARPDSAAARSLLRAALVAAVAAVVFAAAPGVASASQLIARNTSTERLAVSVQGTALLTYHGQGRLQRVLVWGALNARAPSEAKAQAEFRVDYSGGWGTQGKAVWKKLRNTCGPYRGPQLPFLVTACTARDGSHWAIQRWQRHQANFGLAPWKPGHGAWELRVSHWRGPLPKLEVWQDWSYGGRWHHLFGRLTYRGLPGPRVLDDSDGRPARPVRSRPLPRHARLRVRGGLAPRERLRGAEPGRNVLLRVRSPHDRDGRATSTGERQSLPDRHLGAGRDAGRRLGG